MLQQVCVIHLWQFTILIVGRFVCKFYFKWLGYHNLNTSTLYLFDTSVLYKVLLVMPHKDFMGMMGFFHGKRWLHTCKCKCPLQKASSSPPRAFLILLVLWNGSNPKGKSTVKKESVLGESRHSWEVHEDNDHDKGLIRLKLGSANKYSLCWVVELLSRLVRLAPRLPRLTISPIIIVGFKHVQTLF